MAKRSPKAWNEKGGKKTKAKRPTDPVFDALCEAHGIPKPDSEYEFHPDRKWRFDHTWGGWLALEIQGGIFTGGRHTRGAALLKEYEKLNAAVVLGWSVLFCTPGQVEDGSIFPVIKEALWGGL